MTDPTEDQLRRAMESGAAGFSPTADLGATRAQVVGGVRRRQRQVFALGVAVVLLVSGGVVAAAAGGSGSARSRQVAARGAGPSAPPSGDSTTTSAVAAPGVAGGPTGTGATSPGSATPPTTSAPSVGPGTTTMHATTTVQKPPPVTSPSTTVLPSVPEVQGTVRFSPICPVERIPPDPACAPRPGAAHIQLLRADGTVAAEGAAGSSGDFTIPVAPGTYTVKATTVAATPSIGRGCTANPAEVTVAPDKGSTVAVTCDTGIR